MQNFVAAVRGAHAFPVTLQDGINSLMVGLAMIDSIKTQKAVQL